VEKRTGMVWSDNSMRDSGLGSGTETREQFQKNIVFCSEWSFAAQFKFK
jgi:hypothetical protein